MGPDELLEERWVLPYEAGDSARDFKRACALGDQRDWDGVGGLGCDDVLDGEERAEVFGFGEDVDGLEEWVLLGFHGDVDVG